MMMKISLVGMLGGALRDLDTYEKLVADARETGDVDDLPHPDDWPAQVQNASYHRFGIEEQLLKHLRELRDRTMAGDLAALDEFFEIYVFQDDVKYARPDPRAEGWRAGRVAMRAALSRSFTRKVRDGYDWNSALGWADAFTGEIAEETESDRLAKNSRPEST